MVKNVAQRRLFLPSSIKLKKYTSKIKAGSYNGGELREAINEFGATFPQCLTESVTLLDPEK
jgi:hypothetical protein